MGCTYCGLDIRIGMPRKDTSSTRGDLRLAFAPLCPDVFNTCDPGVTVPGGDCSCGGGTSPVATMGVTSGESVLQQPPIE